jgi:hypothetical protein
MVNLVWDQAFKRKYKKIFTLFGLCGVSNFHRRLFNGIVTSSELQRKGWLNDVKKDIDIFFPKEHSACQPALANI